MFNLQGQDGVQLKMLGLSHRTWPSFFFFGGGGGGGMCVPSLNLKINKINVVLHFEGGAMSLWMFYCFSSSLLQF